MGKLFVARIGVGGDDDDHRVSRVALSDSIEHGKTTAAGHDQVEDHQVRSIPLGSNQSLRTITSFKDDVTLV